MCFDTNLRDSLNNRLAEIETEMSAAIRASDDSGDTNRVLFHDLCSEERAVKKELNAIPHRFEVGDGCSSGGNGDAYPYRVIEVSESGKTIKVVPMGYSVHPRSKDLGYGGHDDWIVFDDFTDPDEIEKNLITVTLRKNGRWARKGLSSQGNYGNFYPGACYRYNWEF